jgi:hypothetical protein
MLHHNCYDFVKHFLTIQMSVLITYKAKMSLRNCHSVNMIKTIKMNTLIFKNRFDVKKELHKTIKLVLPPTQQKEKNHFLIILQKKKRFN